MQTTRVQRLQTLDNILSTWAASVHLRRDPVVRGDARLRERTERVVSTLDDLHKELQAQHWIDHAGDPA